MNKSIFFLSLLLSLLLVASCRKEKTSKSGSFEVTYGITTTAPVANTPIIAYTNGSGQDETTTGITGTSWTKSLTITADNRPLMIRLESESVILSAPGSVTGTIYIDGVKKATTTNEAHGSNGYYGSAVPMIYYSVE